jgi:hypothetical protein
VRRSKVGERRQELAFYLRLDERVIGEWSQDPQRIALLGIEGGLPATAPRDLRTGPLFEEIQTWSAPRPESREAKEVYSRMAATPNPGRTRRDDLHFAEWARMTIAD